MDTGRMYDCDYSGFDLSTTLMINQLEKKMSEDLIHEKMRGRGNLVLHVISFICKFFVFVHKENNHVEWVDYDI